jgi:predicted ArsR family transcriptional regulator
VHLHDRLGFRPELKRAKNGKELVLKRCPFQEVATTYQSVICPLHLGLIRGALAELGSGVEADSLQPFARNGACVAHLSGTRTLADAFPAEPRRARSPTQELSREPLE